MSRSALFSFTFLSFLVHCGSVHALKILGILGNFMQAVLSFSPVRRPARPRSGEPRSRGPQSSINIICLQWGKSTLIYLEVKLEKIVIVTAITKVCVVRLYIVC